MRKTHPLFSLLLCAVCLSWGAALPATGDASGGTLRRLGETYRNIRTLRARFVHTLDAPSLNQHEREEGTLLLAKGGKMRWEYSRPEGKLAWADGKKSYLLLPEEREVLVQPLGKDLPVRLLMGDADLSRECTCTGFRKLQGEAELTLEVADAELGLRDLTLRVEEGRGVVTHLAYRDPLGNRVAFAFTDIEVDAPVSEASFKIPIPKGYRVIENP